MFRTIGDGPSLWESSLPPELLRLPDDLAQVGALLDDPVFFAPFAPFFDPVLGRPSTPVECYLWLMFLKFRHRLGYESLCAEVSDSISWRRFCRIPLDGKVPHPTTLMKLTNRGSPAQLFGVLLTNGDSAAETLQDRSICHADMLTVWANLISVRFHPRTSASGLLPLRTVEGRLRTASSAVPSRAAGRGWWHTKDPDLVNLAGFPDDEGRAHRLCASVSPATALRIARRSANARIRGARAADAQPRRCSRRNDPRRVRRTASGEQGAYRAGTQGPRWSPPL